MCLIIMVYCVIMIWHMRTQMILYDIWENKCYDMISENKSDIIWYLRTQVIWYDIWEHKWYVMISENTSDMIYENASDIIWYLKKQAI